MDCDIVDQEWFDLWQSEHRITHSNSCYSMPPIDEDYEWSMHCIHRSAVTLPPIGEEMINVCI